MTTETVTSTALQAANAAAVPAIPNQARWYVVHTYSGREDRTCKNLKQRIVTMDFEHEIFDAVVPKQMVIQMVDGATKEVEKTMYPGYLLVHMVMNDDTWGVVRNTPGVTNFITAEESADGRPNPTPLTDEEAQRMLHGPDDGSQAVNFGFERGDVVLVKDGPFAEFNGTVDEVIGHRGTLRVIVSFFGQDTPVELPFVSVEKA